jgi:hypothetical protein
MIRLIFLCLCLSLTFSAYADDETASSTNTETTDSSSESENTDSETGGNASTDSSGTSIVDFFKDVLGFIDHGIYEVLGDFFKYYVYAVALFNLELKMAAIELATETAEALTEFLNISGTINELLADIDSKIAGFISYLKIPEAITMLLSAHLTRFILDLA